MSVRYSPIKSANITSEDPVTTPITVKMVTPPKDINKSLLVTAPDDKEKNLLENTNYAPDRSYISTPAGNDSGDDVTPPIEELEKDSSDRSLIGAGVSAPDESILDQTDDSGNDVPDQVVSYNEAASKDSEVMKTVQTALGVSNDVSKEQVVRDHLAYNAQFYNTLFYYGEDYIKLISSIPGLDFLEYFFPDVTVHNFYTRLYTSLGRLALHKECYQKLKMRMPLKSNISDPIGIPNNLSPEMQDYLEIQYDPTANWFRSDLSNDHDHTAYCLKLYSILDFIMRSPNLTSDMLSPEHTDILHQWLPRVQSHYDKYQDCVPESDEWSAEIQYLYDLCWSMIDNPYSDDVKATYIANFATELNTCGSNVPNDPSLLTKADCSAYLQSQLGFDPDHYLIPDISEYPVINRYSVRLAMDNINQVEMEYPEYLKVFVKNLNRKYQELGCNFSITPNHPYAKYADDGIVNHMTFLLTEGDTAVSDTDGASDIGRVPNQTDDPFYKRLDYTGTLYRDGSENKEMGPNTKPMQKPDWTQHDSIL